MVWLSIELVEDDECLSFRLPCHVSDLVRLVVAGAEDRQALTRTLRTSPGLLIFSLVEFQKSCGASPSSGHELVAWCDANLIRALADSNLHRENGSCSGASRNFSKLSKRKQKSFLETFLQIRGNSRLRKSLGQFLDSAVMLDAAERKRLLIRIVGMNMRADELKCKRIRSRKTLRKVLEHWQVDETHLLDINQLIRVAAEMQALRSRFDDRLLTEKMAAMKQLAYGASHEINNPLANIATRAQTMLASESKPENRNKLSVIYEQAIRAHEMISDMMLFANPPTLERKRVSLRLLMAKIFHELTSAFESYPGIELVVTVGPAIDSATVDPVHLSVAIKNLIRNSIEAINTSNHQSGRIEIRLTQKNERRIQISIWDNGIGITKEVASHMFDPFYSGREAGRGLGFGLPKVWTIAKLHGGSLYWDKRTESGTRFVMELPIDEPTTDLDMLSELTICGKTSTLEEEAA